MSRTKERRRSLPLTQEVRYTSAPQVVEVNKKSNTDEYVLEGAAVRFDHEYQVCDAFGSYLETMRPGVASAVLARGDLDLRALVNHTGIPLARSTAGTLTVYETPTELRFRAVLDARSQVSSDVYVAVSRGDLTQCSVGFTVARDHWDTSTSPERRTIEAFAELLDISFCTYPANGATSVQVAQRMALEIPVESRARLRRMVANATAGRPLSRDELRVLRSLVTDNAAVTSATRVAVAAPGTRRNISAGSPTLTRLRVKRALVARRRFPT